MSAPARRPVALCDTLQRFYAGLLRLYPRRFREDFAAEMAEVFALALAEAVGSGTSSLVALCLRELGDLPFNLIEEHLRAYQEDNQMHTNDLRRLYLIRWVTRIAGLVIAGFSFAMIMAVLGWKGATPSLELLLVASFGATLVGLLGAWRWEKAGGLLMIVFAALTSLLLFAACTVTPQATEQPVLLALFFALPQVFIGWLFYAIGQRAEHLKLSGEPRPGIRAARRMTQATGLVLTGLTAASVLELLTQGSLEPHVYASYLVMAAMPVGVLVAFWRERLGGQLVIVGALALGATAAYSLIQASAPWGLLLFSVILYMLPYLAVGGAFLLLARQEAVEQAVIPVGPPDLRPAG